MLKKLLYKLIYKSGYGEKKFNPGDIPNITSQYINCGVSAQTNVIKELRKTKTIKAKKKK